MNAYGYSIACDQHFLARGPDDGPIGPTYLAALDCFRKLVAQDDKIGSDDYLVSALLHQYRARLKITRKSGAPGVFEVMPRRFAVKLGTKKVSKLKPYEFDQCLNGQETWNSTTKAHASHRPCHQRRNEAGVLILNHNDLMQSVGRYAGTRNIIRVYHMAVRHINAIVLLVFLIVLTVFFAAQASNRSHPVPILTFRIGERLLFSSA